MGVRVQDIVRWTCVPLINSTRGRGQMAQSTVTLHLKDDRIVTWVQDWRKQKQQERKDGSM